MTYEEVIPQLLAAGLHQSQPRADWERYWVRITSKGAWYATFDSGNWKFEVESDGSVIKTYMRQESIESAGGIAKIFETIEAAFTVLQKIRN